MAEITLSRPAAAALVKEARRAFENGAHELFTSADELQRPIIEASIEVIGRLATVVDRRWPQEKIDVGSRYELEDERKVAFEVSPEVIAWIERTRDEQVGFIADLDDGEASHEEADYLAEQVYLLHVLDGLVGQREAAAA